MPQFKKFDKFADAWIDDAAESLNALNSKFFIVGDWIGTAFVYSLGTVVMFLAAPFAIATRFKRWRKGWK